MLSVRRTIRIEWGDCDPAGIVYFPRYFAYLDACTAGLFEAVGLPKRRLLEIYGILGIPIVDLRARFLAPARFGDEVVVESRIVKWGRSSFEVQHQILNHGDLSVEVFETRVWTTKPAGPEEELKSTPIPEEVKHRFQMSSEQPGS